MSDQKFSFIIQGDSEGYITFECPYCGSEFKLSADELQDDNEPFIELYCPYCGLSKDVNSFYTDEVIEKAKALAMNFMIEELNKNFGAMQRRLNRGKSVIKMSFKPLKKVNVKELKDMDTTEVEVECNCCQHHIKVLYCAGASKVFCSYCGVDI